MQLIKGESRTLYVPLIDPGDQAYRATQYDRTPGQLTLKFGQRLPEDRVMNLPVKVFLSGALEGCFDLVATNECLNEATLDVSDCYSVDGTGRYIKTCCNGMIHVPPNPIDMSFAIETAAHCERDRIPYPGEVIEPVTGDTLHPDVQTVIKTSVVPEEYRGVPYMAVPINSHQLNTAWINRDKLPVGSKVSIPELNISCATITRHQHVQNRFLHLTIDRAMSAFNCPVDVLHSCEAPIELKWSVVGDCPLVKIIIDTNDLAPGATYHWDLFVPSDDGLAHLHRDSFTVKSSY